MPGHQHVGLSLSCHICLKFIIPKIVPNRSHPWNQAGLCGAPGHGSLSMFPVSCLYGIDFSLCDLWVPKNRFRQLLIKEWRECRDRNNWTVVYRVMILPQGIHIRISELFHGTKTPNKWEMFTTCTFFIPEKVTVWEPQKLIRRRLRPD